MCMTTFQRRYQDLALRLKTALISADQLSAVCIATLISGFITMYRKSHDRFLGVIYLASSATRCESFFFATRKRRFIKRMFDA